MRDIKIILFLLLMAVAGHSQTDTTRVKNPADQAPRPDSVLVKQVEATKTDSLQGRNAVAAPPVMDSVLVKDTPAKAPQADSAQVKKAVAKATPTVAPPARTTLAQPPLTPGDSAILRKASGKTLKRLGKSALQQNDPSSAITFFEAYLKNNRSDAAAMYLLGHAYLQIRDYDRAQNMFLNAYTTNKEKAPEALYFHAQMQKSNGKYDSAKVNFQKFKKEYKGDQRNLKKFATREIQLCDSVQKLVATENKIIIQHLDSTINRINTEGGPVSADENTILFTSLRTDKKEYITENDTASVPKRKLYMARRENETWKYEGEYPQLNDPDFNTGNACFSPDRKRIYFTKCKPNFNEKMTCAIYMSENKDGQWSEPVKLPKSINNPKFTAAMPAVTTDPAKGNEVIYFVSNRKEGGKGGMDIWYTVYDKKTGMYRTPRNAGTKINTSGDEISPFFDNETRTLYFSSDGMGGLGGFDVFKATGDGKKWLQTENIGQPINTGADDIFYTIALNREEGFFVSNRKGGYSLKNSTCCDDIYYYKRSEYVRILLSGTVHEMIDPGITIAKATIEVYLKDKKTQEKILVKTLTSDSLGNYSTSLEADRDYMLIVKKTDYLGTTSDVTTLGVTQSKTITKNLPVSKRPKEPIHIPNIQYEFDRANILESSKIAIDTTVLALMEANPELIIEIQSHTDNKGSDQYNIKLSQKRAESVVNYLVSKGIKPDRLKAKGYGENSPVAPNENADGSDNPEGRAQNRRTDFKIIGVVDAEIINAASGLED